MCPPTINPFQQPFQPPVKRKAYFAFDYADIMRVNNVRNAWKITHPDSAQNRSFYDSSLWESSKITDPEQLKTLIRSGVGYTSAVCVLIGTNTWSRQWVLYEIARAVIDDRGLLAVDINGLKHHQFQTAHALGWNPLDIMGVAKVGDTNDIRLCQRFWSQNAGAWQWQWYSDYSLAVTQPRYLPVPAQGQPVSLSQGARRWDFVTGNGHSNIGGWIDFAATQVGR
jgi:hypothetical protein